MKVVGVDAIPYRIPYVKPLRFASGEVHAAELAFIRTVADIFGFSPDEIETMIHRHLGPDPESPYTILGVTPMTDDATVKARYRQLVLETHPDRLMAEGVPADLIAVATRRAAEINEIGRAHV